MFRTIVLASAVAVALMSSSPALAQGTFCDGFRAGWFAAFRDAGRAPNALPACPVAHGSPTYSNGYAAGLMAAYRWL